MNNKDNKEIVRVFKIPDGEKIIIYIPELSEIFYVANSKSAREIPDFVAIEDKARNHFDFENSDYCFTNAVLLLTNACNLNCTYCFGNYGGFDKKNSAVIPLETAYAAINYILRNAQSKKYSKVRIDLFGGEPTLAWETLVRITTYARDQILKNNTRGIINMTTNGFFDKKKAEWLCKNIDKILISLDGPAWIHNKQRGKTFNIIFENAKRIYEEDFKKLSFRITISAFSVRYLPDIVSFLANNFPGCFQLYEPVFSVNDSKCLFASSPNPRDFFTKFLESVEIGRKFNSRIRTSVLKLDKDRRYSFCGVAGKNFMVTYDNRIFACHRMIENGSMGDVFHFGDFNFDKKSFIFDSKKYNFLKKLTIDSIPQCKNCFARYSCAGDCPANKALLYGYNFWRKPSYRCEDIQIATKEMLKFLLNKKEEYF
ncbi:MAG: radical SAM protein [Patescibacteria group bacterium]|nr:radical SAM protein [Patescibacteria group bacterium]